MVVFIRQDEGSIDTDTSKNALVSTYNITDRGIVLPEFSEEFAEFLGALSGDGHLTNSSNTYRVEFTLNGTEDRFYVNFLVDMFRELFQLSPKVYRRRGEANRVDIQIHSKKVHSFLSEFFPKGKKEDLRVPDWISRENVEPSYLRGLMDTDGSLFFAKRGTYQRNSYPVVEFKIYNKNFLDGIGNLLDEVGIDYYRSDKYKIQINGEKRLKKWVSRIGFSNPNRSSRYVVWRLQNYCPPNTTIDQRLDIIRNSLPG